MRRALALLTLTLLVLGGDARAASYDEAARDRPGDFATNRQTILYERPSVDSPILKKLPPKTIVRVVEVTEQWYRIRSTRGAGDGWIRRSYADPFSGGATVERRRFKVGIFRLKEPVVVHTSPSTSSGRVTTLREGAEVRIVDKDPSGLWYKIESESGNRPPGWIPTASAQRVRDAAAGGARPRPTVRSQPAPRPSSRSRDELEGLPPPPAPRRLENVGEDDGDYAPPRDPPIGSGRNDEADRF